MAWVEKRGRLWRGKYRDAEGKVRFAGSSPSKRTAKQLAEDKESEVRRGVWHDPQVGRMTFSEYFEDHWLPNRVGEANTIASYRSQYRSCLKEAFGEVELRNITPRMVQRWVIELQKQGVKAGTIRAKYKALATVLGARRGVSAVRDGLIQRTPCDGIDLPAVDSREVDVYTVAELDRVVHEIDSRWRSIPLLAADTGLRWGELMGIEIRDFSDDFMVLKVRRTITEISMRETGRTSPYAVKDRTKGGQPRTVTLGEDAAAMVRALIEERALAPNDRLFSVLSKEGQPVRTADWPTGLPIGRSYFREYVWKPANVRSGVRPRRFHDLRGSHISWMLAGGADLVTVMKLAGHRNLSTTQVYISAMDDAVLRGRAALEATRNQARRRVTDEE